MDLPKFPSLSAFQGSLRQCSSQTGAENCTQHWYHTQPETVIPGRSGAIQWIRMTKFHGFQFRKRRKTNNKRCSALKLYKATSPKPYYHITIPITETEFSSRGQKSPWAHERDPDTLAANHPLEWIVSSPREGLRGTRETKRSIASLIAVGLETAWIPTTSDGRKCRGQLWSSCQM